MKLLLCSCRYPNYVFYGDTKIAQSAGLGSRYSKDSLRGVMVDIYMLSKCDYLSCTFSSQVSFNSCQNVGFVSNIFLFVFSRLLLLSSCEIFKSLSLYKTCSIIQELCMYHASSLLCNICLFRSTNVSFYD